MSRATPRTTADATSTGPDAHASGSDFSLARALKRELLAEQAEEWRQGRRPAPEEILRRWPGSVEQDADVASVLFQDYQERLRAGEAARPDDYSRRFPKHRDSLASLVARHDLLESIGAPSVTPQAPLGLPEVGDRIFHFRLLEEIGRGAFARVFRAEQADLAGRPVAVKVSAPEGDEARALAQLQHTHIVPIYSVHEDRRAGLRAVCMPYFGGASLSSVLRHLWAGGSPPADGAALVAALRAVELPPPEAVRPRPNPATSGTAEARPATPAASFPQWSYARCAAWLVARLADGLQHAHERGILHRDLKPSNILLGSDGQPMLLDFNLAQDLSQDPARATLGGTVAYMAPEQLRAVARRTPECVARVDGRSDVYSLGMVLFEVLTGRSPFDQSGSYTALPLLVEAMALERAQRAPSLRDHRPDLPWDLEAIIGKCLAPDPARRYQQPAHLAEDLNRFLDAWPLRYAPNLSRADRVRKFVRRHPKLVWTSAVALAALLPLAAAGATVANTRAHLSRARADLAADEARARKARFDAAAVRARCLVNTATDTDLHAAEGREACEEALRLYAVLDRDDWQEAAQGQPLEASEIEAVAEDVRELLLLLAWVQVHERKGDASALREALQLLERAEAISGLGPCRALWTDRAVYQERLGETEQAAASRHFAESLPPTTARDRYLLAVSHVRQGGPVGQARAITELNEALRLNPRHYAAMVQRGICHLEQGEYALAAGDFGACVGLRPDFAWGYFNRGCVFDRTGRKAEAVEDYGAAVQREPGFLPAYVNRGMALLDLRRFDRALTDFAFALARRPDDAALHAGRAMALAGLGRDSEADAAFAEAFRRAAPLSPAAKAGLWCSYGFTVHKRLPAQAREAFDEVLRHEPRKAQALYGCAVVAESRDRREEAMSMLNDALASDPGLLEARRFRAILWARAGRADQAGADINWCLEREPRSGPTLYAAACVAARLAERDPPAALQALTFLEKAFRHGYGRDQAPTDPDLTSLRNTPLFRRLLERDDLGVAGAER